MKKAGFARYPKLEPNSKSMKKTKLTLFVTVLTAALFGMGCASAKWESDPRDPQNVIVEKDIRSALKKPNGELTKADLVKVTSLNLQNAHITDAGLKEVAKLEKLSTLPLNNTKITDAGLKEVAKLEKLTNLSLDGTQITDSAIRLTSSGARTRGAISVKIISPPLLTSRSQTVADRPARCKRGRRLDGFVAPA